MKISGKALLFFVALQAVPAHAYEYEFFEHAGVYAHAGTLGVGVELSIPVIATEKQRHVGVRAGVRGGRYNSNTTKDNVNYNTHFHLFSFYGLVDWYPWAGMFRLTTGMVFNGNKVNIQARPTAGGFTFNNTFYPSGNVDKVDGEITFNKLSPYLGLGWDWRRPGETGWSFSADLGGMYHGSPTASLTANCGPALLPGACDTLRRDVEAEEDQLNNDLKNQKWYPVGALNASFRF